MDMSRPNCPFLWVRPVAPLKHTTINVRAGGDGLEWPGGGAALEAAAAAAWRWRRQLGGSVTCAAVVAARWRWRRRWQRQLGSGGQLGGGGGSLVEARLRQRWQRFGKRSGSAAVAAAAQWRQRQLCGGGQLGDGGGSLAEAAWRQCGRGGGSESVLSLK
jgi:hypothetical protein